MNTSFFLSASFGCLALLAGAAAPALAQGDNVPATGYCTGETIQISGWETDLVRRNKGLEKFHWSAINTVQHYNVVPAGSQQKSANRTLSPYHNSKPQVISNWSDPHAKLNDHSCIASADTGSRSNVSAHLRHNNTSTYAQMRGYDNGYGQQASYGGNRTADGQVSGRVMHY